MKENIIKEIANYNIEEDMEKAFPNVWRDLTDGKNIISQSGVVINHPSNKHFIGSTVLRAEIGKPPRLEVIRNTRLSKLLN